MSDNKFPSSFYFIKSSLSTESEGITEISHEIIYKLPEENYFTSNIDDTTIINLCLPKGSQKSISELPYTSHTFVFKNKHGISLYGSCLRIPEKLLSPPINTLYSYKCLAIISTLPYTKIYLAFLKLIILSSSLTSTVDIESWLVHFVYDITLPTSIGEIIKYHFHQSFKQIPLILLHPYCSPMKNQNYNYIYNFLSSENIIEITTNLLLEKNVICISDDESILTPILETLRNYIYPLKWCHIYFSLAPKSILSNLENLKIPYLIGATMCSLKDVKVSENAIVVDLDRNKVMLNGVIKEVVGSKRLKSFMTKWIEDIKLNKESPCELSYCKLENMMVELVTNTNIKDKSDLEFYKKLIDTDNYKSFRQQYKKMSGEESMENCLLFYSRNQRLKNKILEECNNEKDELKDLSELILERKHLYNKMNFNADRICELINDKKENDNIHYECEISDKASLYYTSLYSEYEEELSISENEEDSTNINDDSDKSSDESDIQIEGEVDLEKDNLLNRSNDIPLSSSSEWESEEERDSESLSKATKKIENKKIKDNNTSIHLENLNEMEINQSYKEYIKRCEADNKKLTKNWDSDKTLNVDVNDYIKNMEILKSLDDD